MTKENNSSTLTDEELRKQQEEWNPINHMDMRDGPAKDMMLSMCEEIYGMSLEEYRVFLQDRNG